MHIYNLALSGGHMTSLTSFRKSLFDGCYRRQYLCKNQSVRRQTENTSAKKLSSTTITDFTTSISWRTNYTSISTRIEASCSSKVSIRSIRPGAKFHGLQLQSFHYYIMYRVMWLKYFNKSFFSFIRPKYAPWYKITASALFANEIVGPPGRIPRIHLIH